MKTIRDALAAMLAAVAVVGVSGCATMDGATSLDRLCRYEKTHAEMAVDAAGGATDVVARWTVKGSEEARLAWYRDNLLFADRKYQAIAALSVPAAARFRDALERGELEANEFPDFLASGERWVETRGVEFSRSNWREYARMLELDFEIAASGLAAAAPHATSLKYRTALQDVARFSGRLSLLIACYRETGNERGVRWVLSKEL